MFGRASRKKKSEEYHEHIRDLLKASSKPVKPQKGMTQAEAAEQAQQVQMHEVRRHTNKHGRVVR